MKFTASCVGVDIAYVTNGYVYHTSHDLPEAITPGSVQRAGENLLGMLTRLSQSPLVADPSGDQHGAMVFYDFLGLYMVLYPQRIGWILNSLIAAITFVCIVLKFSKRSVKDTYPYSKGKVLNTHSHVLKDLNLHLGSLSTDRQQAVFALLNPSC